jgi:nitroimidazol reductase NimA-like FMN-containing flavoprotein (pyridoxamine 5'-phosphate oxidase superfamily)
MRRNEFNIADKTLIKELLNHCDYGTLSLIDQGVPYGVPLNFACFEEGIVFHGAKEGKKMELIAQNNAASFTTVKCYSYIPSYFSHTTAACPATQFFASVSMGGDILIIDDAAQKARALNALMEKMQPEKQYETIDADNPIYTKMVEKTAILKLEPTWVTMKLKLGQQMSQEKKEDFIAQLEERGTPLDRITAKAMREHL